MSKEKLKAVPAEVAAPAPAMPDPPAAPAPTERLMDIDRMALELAKSKRQTALAEAKTALANNENAELSYKYVVLQLYMKYGLTEADAISEAGEVLRGGALQQQPRQ
jgi:hypothetical protein